MKFQCFVVCIIMQYAELQDACREHFNDDESDVEHLECFHATE